MAVSLAAAWQEHDRLAAAIPPRVRATLGGVFTPRALALRMAHETLGKLPRGSTPTVLDPACGLGALLLGAVEWASVQRPGWLAPWLTQGRLQGWEVVREIAEGARRVLAVAAQCLKLQGRPNIVTRDALESDDREIADAVLALPPWKELRGESEQDLPPAKRAQLARRFGSFQGSPSLHGVFAELSGRLLRRPAGRAGLLLPQRAADSPDYATFRKAMAAYVSVEQIANQGPDALPGSNDEAALFVLPAGKGDVSGNPWSARADEGVYMSSIVRHLPLPPQAFGDVGINPGNAAAQLFTDKPEPGAQPVRDGSDVIAFAMRKPRLLLRARPALASGFYARIAPAAVFKQVQIVLKREATRPIAARHVPPAFFTSDLLACFGAPEHDPDYLVGVLNSEYVARLYRNSFRDPRQRALEHLVLEQLQQLPVPSRRAAGAHYEKIVAVARALQQCAGRNPKLLAELDQWVQRAYGVAK